MDKQIEEMAKAMLNEAIKDYPTETVFKDGKLREAFYPIFVKYGEAVYNAGYRKIPEGAVVLTGMETEQQFEDLLVAFDEMGFMPNTTHPFPEEYVETWKQRLIFVFGQLRKEAVEEFAERIKMAFYYEFDELIPSIMADKIDEICKEITEGK